MRNSGDPAIEVRHLQVDRGGRRILHDLSVAVEPGSVTGLLGPSGCGKTTLMRSVVGVQIIAGGSVKVLGRPAGAKELRSRVAYVTQAPSVYGDLTVAENLRYFSRILAVDEGQVGDAIRQVHLDGHADQVVGTLSGGQRTRVSLATALLGSPEVFVLDEPTVGLDPVLRRDLWAMLRGLAEAGATLIVSSHVMDEAAHCDRLLLMRDGRLVAAEPPSTLLERTGAHDLEEAFLHVVEEKEGVAA